MISISNEHLKIRINPHGACLVGITDVCADRELLFAGNPEYWNFSDHILFPFVGRLNGGNYISCGKSYVSDIHGFAKDCDFDVKELSSTSVTLKLDYNCNTLSVYPYKFCLNVCYELKDNTLTESICVTNLDDKTMSFAVGMHPAFLLDENTDDYLLLESGNYFGYKLHNNLLEPLSEFGWLESIKLDKSLFKKYGTLILERKSPKAVIKRKDYEITLNADSPVIAVWADENRDSYVCVESWWGIPDYAEKPIREISEKNKINKIAAGETSRFCCSLNILRLEEHI